MGLKTQIKTDSQEDRHSQKTDTDTQEGTQTEIHTGTETVSQSYQLTFTEVRFIRHF